MTPQEVIKKFMAKLSNHGYAYTDSDSYSIGENMLDSAVRASSRYVDTQAVIDAMKADQLKAEKEAVKEIFGEEKLLSELSDEQKALLTTSAKDNEKAKTVGNAFLGNTNPSSNITVEDVIKERKAYIFLEKYCGIQLPTRFWLSNGNSTYYSDSVTDSEGKPLNLTDNTDTGAITGSDAGGSTSKTDRTIVPESFNTYTAADNTPQNITTDNRDWVVNATSGNDTITSNAEDYINAGAGDDKIIVNGDGATVKGGAGNDNIQISASVKNVTLSDLNEEDALTISGTFEVGSAQIEDTLLVITDKTGTRKIRFGDFESVKNVSLNNSTTIAEWLVNSGIDINNFSVKNYSDGKVAGSSNVNLVEENTGEVDGDERIVIEESYEPSAEPQEVIIDEEETELDKPDHSSNASEVVTVNLADVDVTKENVTADGQIVGTLSNSFPDTSTFTRNGLTIHLLGVTSDIEGTPENIQAKTFNQLTDDQKTIVAGLFKWWAKECITLNEESYGISFNSSTAMIKEIGLYFYDGGIVSSALATVWNWQRVDTDGFASRLMLNVNMNYYNGISADDENGTSKKSGAGFLDRTLAHEFTHAVMSSNINYFGSLPLFIKEGFAELTHGIDDVRTQRIFELAYTDTRLDSTLNISNTGTGDSNYYAGGYMFLRYFAKQAAAQTESLPALADITATVNFESLSVTAGNILYVDSTQTNPAVQIAADYDTFVTMDDKYIALGEICSNGSGGIYYEIYEGVKQIVNTSASVSIVDNINSNTTLNGSSQGEIVFLLEGGGSVNTGAGDDSIEVTAGQYANINAGAGDDLVYVKNGSYHSINLGDGNNLFFSYQKHNYNNTIIGGNGSDVVAVYNETVNVYNYNALIELGAGNDSVYLSGQNNTVRTGDDNDSIKVNENIGNENNFLDAGGGSDAITVGAGSNNSYIGGADNDTITFLNFGSNATAISANFIDGGDGDDYIKVYGSNNTIDGGAGNNVISISGTAGGNVFRYTAPFGEDIICNFKADDTILVAQDYQVSIVEEDTNSILLSVNDQDSIIGYIALLDYETLTEQNIKQEGDYFNGQVIENSDALSVTGTNLNDYIVNSKAGAIIDSRAGFDYIENSGASVSIDAGEDDDGILNDGDSVTIKGGKGNDLTVNEGNYVLFQYTDGDGDDIIYGFNATSTLQIGDGVGDTFSKEIVDNDMIVTVGESKISLIGAAMLSTVNIAGTAYVNPLMVTLTGNADTCGNTLDNATIKTYGGDDLIYNTGASSIIDGGADSDLIINKAESVSINGGAGDDFIVNYSSNVTIDTSEGNDTIRINAEVQSIKLQGFGADDVIEFSTLTSDLETIDGGIRVGDFTIRGVTDLATIDHSWRTSSDSIVYAKLTSAGAIFDDAKLVCGSSNSVENLFTIKGLSSTVGVSLSGNKVILGKDVLEGVTGTVSISGGNYILSLDGDYSPKQIKAEGFDGSAYKTATISDGYEQTDDKTIIYIPASGNETLFKVNGLKNGADITELTPDADGKINLTTALLPDSISSKLELTDIVEGGNYKFVLPSGITLVEKGDSVAASFKGNGTYEYTSSYDKEFYSGSNTAITYNAATKPTTFTISGLKSGLNESNLGNEVKISGNNVTLTATALNQEPVTISDGYTLDLTGVTVGKPATNTTAKFGAVTNGKATYTQTSTTSEYWTKGTDNKSYTFTAADTSTKDLFTLEGVSTVSDGMVKDGKVTLNKSDLASNAKTVKLTGDGYTLDLTGVTVGKPATNTTAKFGAVSNGKATYTQTSTTAEYWVKGTDNKSYTFTAADTSTKDLFTLEGVSTVSDGMVKDGKVTLNKSDLASNAKTVKLTGDGYTLDLTGVTVGKPATNTTAKFGAVSNDKATYTQTSTTAEYWTKGTDNKSYTFTAADTSTKDLFTLEGVSTVSDSMVKDGKVTLNKSDLASNAKTVKLTGDGYTLDLTGVKVGKPATNTTAKFGAVVDGKATYTQTSTTAEYWAKGTDNKSYTFTAADTSTKDLFTLTGVSTVSDNMVKDGKVTLNKSDLASNAKTVKLTGDGYTLDLTGVTVGKPATNTTAKFGAISNGKATYTQTSTTAEYWAKGTDNKSYTFTAADTSTKDLFTLEGVSTVNDSMVKDGKVTLTKSDLASNAKTVKLTGDGYTLDLTGVTVGKPATNTTAKFGAVSNGKATYTQTSTTAEYWAKGTDNKSYTFTAADTSTKDLFTLEGVATVNAGMVKDGKVTVTKSDLASNAKTVKLAGDGYTLDLTGVTVGKPATNKTAKFGAVTNGKATYTQTSTTAEYWTKGTDNKSYTFTATDTSTKDLFTLEGVSTVNDNMVKDGKVTLTKSDLASNAKTVKLTGDGYTLDLTGVTVGKPATNTTAKFGAVTNGKATYTQTSTTAEYWAKGTDNKSYTFTAADTSTKDLFTLEGVATVNAGMVKDGKVTVTKSDLASNAKTVKLAGDGYTLDLTGVTVGKPATNTTAKFGAVTNGKATYTQTSTTAEYWTEGADNKSYTFTAADTSTKDLFTLEGVATVNAGMVKDGKVTLTKSDLANNAKTVKLTGNGYTLDLTGVTVGKPATNTTAKFGAATNGKATYTQTSTTAEYWTKGADNKSYTFTAADTSTKDLFTLEGVSTVSDGMVKDGKVTLTKSDLANNAKTVKLTGDGYTLDLTGVTVGKPATNTTAKFGAVTDGKATYTQTSTTAEYWTKGADNKSYTFTAADTSTKDLFTLEGVSTVSDGMVKDGKVTLNKSDLASNAKTVKLTGDGYTLDLTGVTVGKPATNTTAKFGAVTDGKATYTQTSTTAEYWAKGTDNKSYTFTAADTSTKDLFTLEGVSTVSDGMVKDGKVTLTKSDLASNAKTIKLTGDGYTLDLTGVTVGKPATNTTAKFGAVTDGKATYTQTSTTAEYWTKGTDNKSYTFTAADTSTKDLFTLEGVSTVSDGMVKDGKVTVTKSDLASNAKTVKLTGNGYTLDLTGVTVGKPATNTTTKFGAATNGKATYTQTSTTAEYWTEGADNKSYTFTAADTSTKDLFTLEGVSTVSDGMVKDGKVTLTKSDLASNAKTVKLTGDGYTLDLTGVTVGKPATNTTAKFGAVADGKATYTQTLTTAEYWTKGTDNKSYTFTAADTSTKDLFTLEGVSTVSDGMVKDGKVTLNKSDLASNAKTVKLTGDGYTLDLTGVTVGKPATNTTAKFGAVVDDKATYTQTLTTAEYWAKGTDNKSYTFTAADTSTKDLFTLEGVSTVSDGMVKDGKVTLTKSDLASNAKTVKLTGDGYTLDLTGVTVGKPATNTTAKFGAVADGKATYTQTLTTAEYWTKGTDNKSYTFTAVDTSTKDLFTLEGVATVNAGMVKDGKVTLTKSDLASNAKTVKLTGDGYTLDLTGVTVGKPATKTTAKFGAVADGKATYTQTSTTAEYWTKSADSKSYTFTAADTSTKDLFTLTGVKNTTGIVIDTTKKTITLTATNLNKKNVTINGGYKLKLASNVDTTRENISAWTTLKSGNAAYLADGKGEYYSIKGGNVIYNASVAGANKIEFSGIKGTPTLDGNTVKLTAGNFKSNVSVANNAGGYKVSLSGNFKGKSFTGTSGVDSITNAGKNISIAGGKGNDSINNSGTKVTISGGAGDDVVTLGSGNTFYYAKGDGNDSLYKFSDTDKIKVSGTTATPTISGKDVILKTSGGKITVKNAAQGNKITIVDAKDKVLSAYTYSADGIADGKSITLNANHGNTFKAGTFTNVDGSKVSKAIKIIGGNKASTLSGGAKNDSIIGGKGNDKLIGNAGNDTLTGGKGKDVFIFSGGKDTITDYTAGNDKISITGNLGKGSFSVNGKNVVLTYGNNSLTITNGLNKTITFADGLSGTYTKNGVFNKDKTAVTLSAASKTFKAMSYSTLVTVDASATSSTINITGNDKNNYFISGNNGSTLSGGKGKDSLVGGDDKDSLIGEAGNDKLYGGKGNDTLWGGAGNDTLYGGKGNDTLQGGTGKDVFVYANGDGKDIILDYDEEDTIKITKGNVKVATSGDNVIFTVGSGKMTLNGAADKIVNYIDANGAKKTYSSAPSFIEDDTDYELTPRNDLSSLVQSKAVDYSFANTSTELGKENNLITYSGSKK